MRGQRGAVLLEVLISAVVLFVATGATLAVLDGSARTSASSRDRLVAANLAEEDQERLRGLSLVTLKAGAPQAPNQEVNDLVYSITSEVRGITDSLGFQPTCTSGTESREDYLLLTSTVTRPGSGMAPVVVRSLLAPRASTTGYKGSLSIPFVDRNDTPLANVPASVTGPDPLTTVTSVTSNASGCAVFRDLDAGTYVVKYSRTGYVTPAGTTGTVSLSGTIVPGQTNFTATQPYDLAAQLTAKLRTIKANGTDTTATAAAVSVTTSDSRGGGAPRVFPVSPAAGSIGTGKVLFPFTVPYSVFAGTCAANAPPAGQPAQTAQLAPGGGTDVDVYAPTLQLKVPSGQTASRAFVRSTDAGCSQLLPFTFTATTTTTEIAVPFGNWSVCIDNNASRSYTKTAKVDTRAATTVDLGTGASTTASKCAAT